MDEHLEPVEDRLRTIEERLARLEAFFPEGRLQAARVLRQTEPASAPAPAPSPPPAATVSPEPAPAPERDFGRVIAWAGGLAFTTGLVLLVSLAVERGWIGPGVRFVLGLALALAATGLSVALSSTRELFSEVVESEVNRRSVARALFVAGLVGGYAAAYAGFARWDLYGYSALSILIALLTFMHLVLGHVSGDIVRAGSAIAGAFLVPIYAQDLASVRVEAWPALILFAGAAVLAVAWARRSASVTAWILATVGVAALLASVEPDSGTARLAGIWMFAAVAGATVWMVATRLRDEDRAFSFPDGLLIGWLALAAGGLVSGWAFFDPQIGLEIGVVVALTAIGLIAHRAAWREVADGLTVAATVFAFLAIEALIDEGIVAIAYTSSALIAVSVWWATRWSLTITKSVVRSIALVIAVITVALPAASVLDDEIDVVLSVGLVLIGLIAGAFFDEESWGRWAFGSGAAFVWVSWWAAFSGLTFEPDAITTAGWFATAIGAILVGRQRRILPVQIGGLALGGVSYLKLFLYDLSAVEPALRIVLFLVVGAALVVFAYRSGRARQPRA